MNNGGQRTVYQPQCYWQLTSKLSSLCCSFAVCVCVCVCLSVCLSSIHLFVSVSVCVSSSTMPSLYLFWIEHEMWEVDNNTTTTIIVITLPLLLPLLLPTPRSPTGTTMEPPFQSNPSNWDSSAQHRFYFAFCQVWAMRENACVPKIKKNHISSYKSVSVVLQRCRSGSGDS